MLGRSQRLRRHRVALRGASAVRRNLYNHHNIHTHTQTLSPRLRRPPKRPRLCDVLCRRVFHRRVVGVAHRNCGVVTLKTAPPAGFSASWSSSAAARNLACDDEAAAHTHTVYSQSALYVMIVFCPKNDAMRVACFFCVCTLLCWGFLVYCGRFGRFVCGPSAHDTETSVVCAVSCTLDNRRRVRVAHRA